MDSRQTLRASIGKRVWPGSRGLLQGDNGLQQTKPTCSMHRFPGKLYPCQRYIHVLNKLAGVSHCASDLLLLKVEFLCKGAVRLCLDLIHML
jgi:hypothetical protein